MPTESKDHAAGGKSLDLLADDTERNAYTETLEQAPTLATATTTDGSIAPFPTAQFPDKLAEEVEYGAGGVKGLAENPYVFGAAFLASLGGFSFGYDQGVISVINVMPQFHNAYPRLAPDAPSAEFWKGFMTGMLELGAFLGCFFFPQLADTISRKWSLSIVAGIFIIGAIMQTAAPDYAVLVAGRTITGVGVGTMALGAPLYISEVSPPQVRGTLLVLESLAIVMGVVSSYWVAYGCQYIDNEASFRVPFGLQMVSAGIIGTMIHCFPYSPRWLVLVERDEDALESLARLRRLPATDSRVVTEWRGILAEIQFQKIMAEKAHPGKQGLVLELLQWADLFRKKTWRRTVVGVGVAFFQQFSGVNAFIYYAPTLFTSLGQADLSLILAGTLNIGQLVAVMAAFLIVDAVGRRTLAIWGALAMGVPYVVIAALYGLYSDDWPAHPAAGWACVAMAYVYICAYGISYSALAWALPSEVYSTVQRSKGVALATATVWLSNFIVGVATPPMISQAGFGTYVFFAIMCFLGVGWAWTFVPETKGKTLEELDDVFGDATGQEEHEVMRSVAAEARRR
ncbi:hexose carrier protein [Hortaea werneckii]|nr:hexose carrier protein [Hortaea werneckii]